MSMHQGGCHCRKLRYRFETALILPQLPLRACQCTFCRRHGALSTSDPNGRVQFAIGEPQKLIRYRFGLKLADFLICGNCGIYVAALMTEGDKQWTVINANTLDHGAQLKQAPTPMDYDGESDTQRLARRKSSWTPVASPNFTSEGQAITQKLNTIYATKDSRLDEVLQQVQLLSLKRDA